MRDLALAFLRLGASALGGPAAHIAMMADEFARGRAWLTPPRVARRASTARSSTA